jgi:hypothetical protein
VSQNTFNAFLGAAINGVVYQQAPNIKDVAAQALGTQIAQSVFGPIAEELLIWFKLFCFLIPSEHVKNREERLVVLNHIAKSVIDEVRGQHSEYVFTYNGKPVAKMLRSAWRKARKRAALLQVRVHDLKHTFGRRLRSAGVCFEDRQDLLGHKSGRITTHYSAAELTNLIEAADKVCAGKNGSVLTMLKNTVISEGSRKSPARDFLQLLANSR